MLISEILKNVDQVFGFVNHYETPAIRVFKNDKELLLQAEIAGVDSSTLDVKVLGDILTISGDYFKFSFEEQVTLVRQEFKNGKFSRTVELPEEIDDKNVSASLKDGLLSVHLPLKEQHQAKSITVHIEN